MASNLRLLGYNIKRLASAKGVDLNDLASSCGLSLVDIKRVFEGRLALVPRQISVIANSLNCEVSQLLVRPNNFESYGECMGDFKNPKNEDIILNIIDDYIDLKESVQ